MLNHLNEFFFFFFFFFQLLAHKNKNQYFGTSKHNRDCERLYKNKTTLVFYNSYLNNLHINNNCAKTKLLTSEYISVLLINGGGGTFFRSEFYTFLYPQLYFFERCKHTFPNFDLKRQHSFQFYKFRVQCSSRYASHPFFFFLT